jgi:methoxymalonate biosynthesis acyl carrier protein
MSAVEQNDVITSFLLRHTKRPHLDPAENIFTAGYVDSLFAMQLIMFIEKKFDIQIEPEDLDLANFCSVTAIERFVREKSAAVGREPA